MMPIALKFFGMKHDDCAKPLATSALALAKFFTFRVGHVRELSFLLAHMIIAFPTQFAITRLPLEQCVTLGFVS